MRQFNVVVLGGPSTSPKTAPRSQHTAGGVGKSALTGNLVVVALLVLLNLFPVRFIRDVFVENYDPTIEGLHTLSALFVSFIPPPRGIQEDRQC